MAVFMTKTCWDEDSFVLVVVLAVLASCLSLCCLLLRGRGALCLMLLPGVRRRLVVD